MELDTTATGFYALSEPTKNLLGRLSEPVTAYAVRLPSSDRIANDIRQLLLACQDASNGKFQVKIVNEVANRDELINLVNKYPREQLPEALTGYITDRTGYDYHHHAEVGSSNAAFVGDEVTDRFCILGSADEHVAKLRELADAGVDQFNFYLMNGDEEQQVEAYGKDVIPGFA